MQQCLSNIINIDINLISIKATTTDKLGYLGAQEGIMATASILIKKHES